MNDYKEMPLDLVILCFLQLSIYYCNEILLGFGNKGKFHLRKEFRSYFIYSRYIETRDALDPKMIIESIIKDS